MKISFLIPPHYDYLSATLVEGLIGLGHVCASECGSNYTKKLTGNSFKDFVKYSDIVVVSSGELVNHRPLLCVQPKTRIVFIDGSDYTDFSMLPDCRVNSIFKREYLFSIQYQSNELIHPISFAIESRYLNLKKLQKRKYDLTFVGSMNNVLRSTAFTHLQTKNDKRIFTGSSGEVGYDGITGTPYDTPKYFSTLRSSTASVDIPGKGWDCGRAWEIIGSRSALIKFRNEILYANPLIEGEHYLGFSNMKELDTILELIRSSPKIIEEMEERCFEYSMVNHTTVARAEYFIERIFSTDISKIISDDDFLRRSSLENVRLKRVLYRSARRLYNHGKKFIKA